MWSIGGPLVQVTYASNTLCRCGACSKGWFDLGGPAWRALTSGALPGHIYGVKSRWVSCPASLTGGSNLHVYVKPGSHPWDARFQVFNSMSLRKVYCLLLS